MKKISIGLVSLIVLAWAYLAYAQTSKETIEKRRIEKAIELGSGSFTILDDVGIGTGSTQSSRKLTIDSDGTNSGLVVRNTNDDVVGSFGPENVTTSTDLGIYAHTNMKLYTNSNVAMTIDSSGGVVMKNSLKVDGNLDVTRVIGNTTNNSYYTTISNLSTTPQSIMNGVAWSGINHVQLVTTAGDVANFTIYMHLDAGVQITVKHSGNDGSGTVSIVSTSSTTIDVSGIGDGKTYTFAFNGSTGIATIAASGATTGSTVIKRLQIF